MACCAQDWKQTFNRTSLSAVGPTQSGFPSFTFHSRPSLKVLGFVFHLMIRHNDVTFCFLSLALDFCGAAPRLQTQTFLMGKQENLFSRGLDGISLFQRACEAKNGSIVLFDGFCYDPVGVTLEQLDSGKLVSAIERMCVCVEGGKANLGFLS
jgi:hypothetical protein